MVFFALGGVLRRFWAAAYIRTPHRKPAAAKNKKSSFREAVLEK